jgi:cell shape-determining protein MreC
MLRSPATVCKCSTTVGTWTIHADKVAHSPQAEVQQLKQQLSDAQQHKDNELQALEASKSGLQEQLAAVTTEAKQLREQLSSTAQEMQVCSSVFNYLAITHSDTANAV